MPHDRKSNIMPHDKNGVPVQEGDIVTFRAHVLEVYEGEDACNASFKVLTTDAAAGEYLPHLMCNTRLAEKMQKAMK